MVHQILYFSISLNKLNLINFETKTKLDNEDFNEIQQEMNRIEDRFDEIAPCAQSLEQQDKAEGDKDLHPDFAGNYNLSRRFRNTISE